MLPDIDLEAKPAQLKKVFKECYSQLVKCGDKTDEIEDFATALPIDELVEQSVKLRQYSVCCVVELIRLYFPHLPFSIESALDLIIPTFPYMAEAAQLELLACLRVFQWIRFETVFENIQDDEYASNWLKMCDALAISENGAIVNALPQLCAPVADEAPIVDFLKLASDNSQFWVLVAKKITDYPERVTNYFSSAMSLENPVVDVTLYTSLAVSDPVLVGGYEMPILNHWNPAIRVLAVEAYAKIHPGEDWVRRHEDKDVSVRRQWAQCAMEIGYRDKMSVLYADPDPRVREFAYQLPPSQSAKASLFRLLKHPDASISTDAVYAYAHLASGPADFEILIRWIARNIPKLYDTLAALRTKLDENIHCILSIENAKSENALMLLLAHTLKLYNAISTYSDLEQDSRAQKAVIKWLDNQKVSWEPILDHDINQFSSKFKCNAVPLVSAEWALENASKSPFAQRILNFIAEKSPRLLKNCLPLVTSSAPRYLLDAIAKVSAKFPRKIVNPTTSILRDICLESDTSSKEAAEILYYCSREFFRAIAPEILERVLADPSENAAAAVTVVAKVQPVHEELRAIASEPNIAPVYAATCPENAITSWTASTVPSMTMETRSKVLLALAARSVPTSCLPFFGCDICDDTAFALAERLVNHQASQRFVPLLLFHSKHKQLLKRLNVKDIYGAFARMVYILAVNGDMNVLVVRRFCETFAAAENISTLVQLSHRFKHFELAYSGTSMHLYSLSELCERITNNYREAKSWEFVEPEDVKLPADCFTPLPLNARQRVVRTSYLDEVELEELVDLPNSKKLRSVKV